MIDYFPGDDFMEIFMKSSEPGPNFGNLEPNWESGNVPDSIGSKFELGPDFCVTDFMNNFMNMIPNPRMFDENK